jgi:hypothetical protein
MFMHLQQRKVKLDAENRNQTLNQIVSDEATFIEAQRQAEVANGIYNKDFAASVLIDFEKLKQASQSAKIDELDRLVERSSDLKILRAYVLPPHEIQMQGNSVLSELSEWSVPPTILKSLHDDIFPILNNADICKARSALYRFFDESDYWSSYIDWFSLFMRRIAGILMGLMLLCLIASFFFLLDRNGPTKGFVLAGACGALVSIISKLPPIVPYGETAGYIVRIISRTATGIAACVIGYGFLASGILSSVLPENLKVSEIIDRMSTETTRDLAKSVQISQPISPENAGQNPKQTPPTKDGATKSTTKTRDALTLVAIAMLFGFSERALVSFENKLFPVAEAAAKQPK